MGGGGGTVVHIRNRQDWKQHVLEKGTRSPKVIVDFYASWCPPCRMIGPVFENLSKKYSAKIKFVKVDVDENRPVATKCDIQSMPTFQIYLQGERVDTLIGADKDKLEKLIEDLVAMESDEPVPEEKGAADEPKKGIKQFFKTLFSKEK